MLDVYHAQIGEGNLIELREIGYQGTVGLEAWAASDSELALERFQAAFSVAH